MFSIVYVHYIPVALGEALMELGKCRTQVFSEVWCHHQVSRSAIFSRLTVHLQGDFYAVQCKRTYWLNFTIPETRPRRACSGATGVLVCGVVIVFRINGGRGLLIRWVWTIFWDDGAGCTRITWTVWPCVEGLFIGCHFRQRIILYAWKTKLARYTLHLKLEYNPPSRKQVRHS